MISKIWCSLKEKLRINKVRKSSRKFVSSAGYAVEKLQEIWKSEKIHFYTCPDCEEVLDEIKQDKIVHTHAGETFKYPVTIAAMCSRCCWISDGKSKTPIWRWLRSKQANGGEKEFFLRQEKAALRMRLAEIEKELRAGKTLILPPPGFSSIEEDE